MVEATITTKHGFKEDIQFNSYEQYRKWRLHWKLFPNSNNVIHGWGRSLMYRDITKVILKRPKIERGNFKCQY